MNSFNHYSFGAIGDWLLSNALGIAITDRQPGTTIVEIRPEVDQTGAITWSEGSLESPAGSIEARWEIKDGMAEYRIKLPESVHGRLITSKGKEYILKENNILIIKE